MQHLEEGWEASNSIAAAAAAAGCCRWHLCDQGTSWLRNMRYVCRLGFLMYDLLPRRVSVCRVAEINFYIYICNNRERERYFARITNLATLLKIEFL